MQKKYLSLIVALGVVITASSAVFADNSANIIRNFSNKHVMMAGNVEKSNFVKMHKASGLWNSTIIKSNLDKLVTAGTITQTQEDAIVNAVTSEQQKDGHKLNFKGILDNLVKAGTITEAQETSIIPAKRIQLSFADREKGILDKLVTAGTITQTQEDSIISAFNTTQQKDGRKFDLKSILSNIVTDGTITEAQETSVQNAFKVVPKTHNIPNGKLMMHKKR